MRQPYPLLLAAKRVFDASDFAGLMRACVVISMRFNEADALAYRLGNMTLMQAGANKEFGNAAYAQKRAVFEQSGFAITAKLAADHAEWTPERIAVHQSWMATQATTIWRIAQMG